VSLTMALREALICTCLPKVMPAPHIFMFQGALAMKPSPAASKAGSKKRRV